MKPRIRLGFADFWSGFNPRDNWFLHLLSREFAIELSDEPDFLLYSCFGKTHHRYKCYKIFYTGENVRPEMGCCDFAFTFDYLKHPRHYRIPLWARKDVHRLIKSDRDPAAMLAEKTRFCNFVFSNPRCAIRNRFLDRLSRYKRVDSAGGFRNNIGRSIPAGLVPKLDFLRRYKFTIAFENASHPGYTTEKIIHPMMVGSVPIYWGDPLVHRDFNTKSFVNYHDYGSLDELVDRMIELDRNDDLYLQMLREPWFHGNEVPPSLRPEAILACFRRLFASRERPAAQSRLYPVHRFCGKVSRAWNRFRRSLAQAPVRLQSAVDRLSSAAR